MSPEKSSRQRQDKGGEDDIYGHMVWTVFLYFGIPFLLVSFLCVGIHTVYFLFVRQSIPYAPTFWEMMELCFSQYLALTVTIPVISFIFLYLRNKNVDTLIQNERITGVIEDLCDNFIEDLCDIFI